MTRFAQSARRLAGLAGALLGWTPDGFWAATPDELATILEAIRGEADGDPPTRDDVTRLKEMFPDG